MLVERWRYMRDRLDMAEVAEKKFAHRLVAWDEWDLELREKFSYEGCPIGPRGCHMDAPVMCRSCGDKKAGAAQ
jgi:hypothetical protein